jgi:hypothetical protein
MFRRYDYKSVTPDTPWKSKNLAIMIYHDQLVTLKPAQKLPVAVAP